MMIRFRDFRLLLLALVLLSVRPGWGSVDIDQLRGEAYADIGSLVSARGGVEDFSGYYLSRLGVILTAEKTIEEKLRLNVGVGGLFYQPFPKSNAGFWTYRNYFGPGVTQASAEFSFKENMKLKGGYFDYKYSPSMNLGEYLLRSQAYPTVLRTGSDWTWVDSAYNRTLGLRFNWNWFGGKLRHEAGLFFEYRALPLFDMTPTYLLTLEPVPGLELGGGVALYRWIPANAQNNRGSLGTNAVDPKALYVEIGNFPEVQNQAQVLYTDALGAPDSSFAAWRGGATFDQAAFLASNPGVSITEIRMVQNGSVAGPAAGIQAHLQNLNNCDSTGFICQDYYRGDTLNEVDANGQFTGNLQSAVYNRRQAIKDEAVNLMGRATLDLAKLLSLRHIGGFKVFAEIAVLGLENQPVYYQNVGDRIPVLLGAQIPTFGLLDLLSVEVEYCRNPYPNSDRFARLDYAPVPDLDQDLRIYSITPNTRDDWNWSVHAAKTLVSGVQLKVQVANDHLRLLNYTGEYNTNDALVNEPGHWYFLTHLQWGF